MPAWSRWTRNRLREDPALDFLEDCGTAINPAVVEGQSPGPENSAIGMVLLDGYSTRAAPDCGDLQGLSVAAFRHSSSEFVHASTPSKSVGGMQCRRTARLSIRRRWSTPLPTRWLPLGSPWVPLTPPASQRHRRAQHRRAADASRLSVTAAAASPTGAQAAGRPGRSEAPIDGDWKMVLATMGRRK